MIGIPNVEVSMSFETSSTCSTRGIDEIQQRWGRRKMMMYAATGQCLSYLLITILLRYNELAGYSGSKKVASASVAFFFT